MVAILTLIAQGASPAYLLCKDMFLYAKRQRRDIEALEERISKLIIHLTSINSAKEKIDRTLKNSVSAEESDLYKVTKSEIAVIHKKYTKFIHKYTMLTTNQLSPATVFDASSMIEKLGDLRSKMMTFNFYKLAKLSRDVTKLSTRASEAVDKMKPENMIQKKSEPNLEKLDDVAAAADDVLPVFNKYVDKILEYLRDEEANQIGILGCQGAGKTTVLRKLYNRLLEHELLDNIIWIEYPTEIEEGGKILEMLQNEIMEQLEIHHESAKSIVKNANTISAFLREKRYVLLMDHVSTSIDLDKLGIRECHKYKKIVICSREKNVLDKMTERKLKIKGLNDGEALLLFENIYGRLHNDSRRSVAERIIECCAGIPWIIRGVAVYLRDKRDDKSWHYVKRILQSKSNSLDLIDLGGFDKVYEMKYECLPPDSKKCLLYGALFPHQYKIYTDYLVECWIAEGFIVEEADQKVRANRERGQIILNKLTDDDLLRWHSGNKCVMMPPNFRRVALGLDYPDEGRCAIWAPSVDRKPNDATWKTVTRMSLIGCKMELPQTPQCCKIYTLLLQSLKPKLEHLADSFFLHMWSLQVLDLNQTEIRALPGSIEKLVNLKGLYLNGCPRLASLPPEAASLVKLEFLDISGTSISTLPEEIRFMVSMRCLRASLSGKRGNRNCKGKKMDDDSQLIVPPGIISKLTNLEELSIDITGIDIQQEIAVAERLATELASLEYLNTLCFNFPNVSSLSTFVSQSRALMNKETSWETNTFRSFKIFIGCHETRRSCEPDLALAERWLRYSTNEEFSLDCQELLKQATAFEIIGDDGIESLTCSKFDLRSVQVCVVERCNNLENIVDGGTATEEQSFFNGSLLENLEKLHLYDLNSLKCFWDGYVPSKSLVKLTAITIDGCPNLTKILDPALVRSLKSLEYLKVENCGKISRIIEWCGESEASEIVEVSSNSELLTSLRKIELSNLPELVSICETTSISWNSLKSIIVMRCSNLRNLSLTRTNARKLASIQCEESWWRTLTPDDLKERLLPICCFQEESIEGEARSRGEGSSSGRSELNQTSNINVDDDEKETPLSDNHQTSQIDLLDDDDIKANGNHQHFCQEIQAGRLAPAV